MRIRSKKFRSNTRRNNRLHVHKRIHKVKKRATRVNKRKRLRRGKGAVR